ncbi:MAG: hypothetical protein IPN20_26125 [Haliscomenobacter sp.]|nr:hypothetical protein [Haliscomenobacter sp.]
MSMEAFGHVAPQRRKLPEQILASSIERIEIITNPSAKYRPDGVGGIINLVLKREAGQGWNGLLGLNIGNEERANGNARVNYGGKKNQLHRKLWHSAYGQKDAVLRRPRTNTPKT